MLKNCPPPRFFANASFDRILAFRFKMKRDLHPELFGADEDESRQLSMLDALYDEGIIPTYSFPKDVVGLYIEDHNRVVYQPERGLNIAISEYAPGRAVTIDKQTYQIGGIYARPFPRTARVEDFFRDEHYYKNLSKCKCGCLEHLVPILKDAGVDLKREADGTVYAQKGSFQKKIDVYPAMEAGSRKSDRTILYVSRNALRFAKPDAFECIVRGMSR